MEHSPISKKSTAILLAALFAACSLFAVASDSSSADVSYEVTDGNGNKFTFTQVPEHVIAVGSGVVATVIELNDIDKLLVCDNYSAKDTSSVFDALRAKIDAGKVTAGGNIYSSGRATLVNEIIAAADTEKGGTFDKEHDVIIATGSSTYMDPFLEALPDDFKYVLTWESVTTYEGIVDFVSAVSKAIDGEVSSKVTEMQNAVTDVQTKIAGLDVREAFFVTYSGSAFKVGNTGSIANSMISAAGGKSITTDSTKTGSTYETDLTTLMEAHQNAVIFVDKSIYNNETNLASLKTRVGNATLVNLDPLWNNYCISSMDGVTAMAQAMYPSAYEEGGDDSGDDSGSTNSGSNDNTMLYVGVGGVAVVALLACAFIFLRKH